MDNNDRIETLFEITTNLRIRIQHLEANSRKAARSDQPIVGPPSQSEDSRALARPEILAQVKTFVKDLVDLYSKMDGMVSVAVERSYFKKILQHLNKLDQGPVAQKPATEITLLDERGRPHV